MTANLFLILILLFSTNGEDIRVIRRMYTESVENRESAEQLIRLLSAKPKTPLTTGYLGAVNMVMAKHVFNPVSKLNYFRSGKGYLDKSIRQSPADPELRFLRHAIQVTAPSFLGYNAEKQVDRSFLMSRLQSGKIKDKQLQMSIVKFLMIQKATEAEKKLLNNIHKNQ